MKQRFVDVQINLVLLEILFINRKLLGVSSTASMLQGRGVNYKLGGHKYSGSSLIGL